MHVIVHANARVLYSKKKRGFNSRAVILCTHSFTQNQISHNIFSSKYGQTFTARSS